MKKKWILSVALIVVIATVWYFTFAKRDEQPVYNLVVITVDTLRADYLGCYGYGNDKLSARDIRDWQALVKGLRFGAAPLPKLLRENFSQTTLKSLNAAQYPFSYTLKKALLTEINFALESKTIDRADLAKTFPGIVIAKFSAQTPNIDALAKEGTIFLNAYAQAPLTLPSHASLFTGVNPNVHGVRDNNWYRLPQNLPTMAEILKEYGYQTAGVVSATPLAREKGLDRGFDQYDEVVSGEESGHIPERKAEESVALAMEHLQRFKESRKPFFLWLHLFDPHAEYNPPAPFREKFADDPYLGEIAYTDHCLGTLFDTIKKQFGKNTIIVFVSDHGEGLGHHGELSHGYFTYNSTLHVPLIFYLPGKVKKQAQLEQTTRVIDIMPTTLSLMGIKNNGQARGLDLSGYLIGSAEPPWGQTIAYAESYFPHHAFGWRPARSIIMGQYKYIPTRKGELYDIHQDPYEWHNLIGDNEKKAKELQQKLDLLLKEKIISSDFQQSQNALRGLGYYSAYPSGDLAKEEKSGPDPQEMTHVIKKFVKGQSCMWQGNDHQALKLFKEILVEDPENATCQSLLGKLYLRNNMLPQAKIAFEHFYYGLRPHLKIARNGLIDTLIRLGDLARAETVARRSFLFRILRKDVDDLAQGIDQKWRKQFSASGNALTAQAELIKISKKQWQIRDAKKIYYLTIYQENINVFCEQLDEQDAMLLSLFSYLQLEKRNFSQAIIWARKAALLDANLAGAHFYLGRALFHQKKYSEAALSFQRALKVKSHWAEAIYIRGESLWLGGRANEANKCWQQLQKLSAGDPFVLYYQAQVLHYQKKYREAAQKLSKALDLQPHWPRAIFQRGLYLKQAGEGPMASAAWQSLYQLPQDQPTVCFFVGRVLCETEQWQQAGVYFAKSLSMRSNWYQAMYYSGLCQWQQGERKTAGEIWQRITRQLETTDSIVLKIQEHGKND